MATIAIDWDGTLVVSPSGAWLPGALEALRYLVRNHTVLIHSCRANWPEGQEEIRQRLGAEGLREQIDVRAGKPEADLYIDDRALRFADWTIQLPEVEQLLHEHAKPISVLSSLTPKRPSALKPLTQRNVDQGVAFKPLPKPAWKRF